MLKVGDELGRYEIIAHLKSGGMATLYLGRRVMPADNRIFAIKVVHPHFLDDEDLVAMFEDEARLSLRITHPNVVHVEEVGEDAGVHYLAMEYVHGCSVAQLLQALIRRRRRMSPELAVYVAMQVCEGLHAAHSLLGDHGEPLNVVHRDVSPQNILLAHTGELRLIDFGIAKSRARMHHSATGSSIRGKLRYMSPEHAKGKSVDNRTDLYALGIVLWEMLTMRPLFWGETDFDVLTKVQDPIIEPPSAYAPNISPALDDAVLIALSPDREARPSSALEFRQLLSTAVPIAEALDEEQIAELLHAVLGEEMIRVADRMPSFVSMELKFSNTGTATDPQPRPELSDHALDSLTGPTEYDPDIVQTFVGDMPAAEGISGLLGAAAIELMEEESSTTISAVALAEYLEKTAGRARGLGEQGEVSSSELDDPTDPLTGAALSAFNRSLRRQGAGLRPGSAPSTDVGTDDDDEPDTVTFDEVPEAVVPAVTSAREERELDSSALELDSREVEILGDIESYDAGFEDPEDETTLKGTDLPISPAIEPPSETGEVTRARGASWRGVEPSALGIDIAPGDAHAHDAVQTDATTTQRERPEPPTEQFELSLREQLPVTGEGFPPAHDSEPPTEIWDGPPNFFPEPPKQQSAGGFGAGDRAALLAGIAVAMVLLVGIAAFLLL